MPENSMPKEAAYQIVKDELMLDGNPRLNLASFVTTWMEPECDNLIMSSINKNYVDMDEYPVTTELQVVNDLDYYMAMFFFFVSCDLSFSLCFMLYLLAFKMLFFFLFIGILQLTACVNDHYFCRTDV